MSNITNAIDEAMYWIEQLPCGGIGIDGATAEELSIAEEDGKNVGNDAMLHYGQRAWLVLNELKLFLCRTQ